MNKKINTNTQDIIDFTKDGKCSGCGNCCPNLLPVTKSEIEKIKNYIKKHNIKPHQIKLPIANVIVDATCPFLDNTKSSDKCKIYAIRPSICRCFICSDVNDTMENILKSKINEKRIVTDMHKTFFSEHQK